MYISIMFYLFHSIQSCSIGSVQCFRQWSIHPSIRLSVYPSIRLSFYPYGLPLSFFWSEYQATGCPFKLLFEQTHRGSKKKRHSKGYGLIVSNSIWEIFLSEQNFQIKMSSIRNVWIKSQHENWKRVIFKVALYTYSIFSDNISRA